MPHFHARYAEHKVSVRICDGFVSGRFPARELRRVLEWYDLHRDELQAAWDLAQRGESPRPIAPME